MSFTDNLRPRRNHVFIEPVHEDMAPALTSKGIILHLDPVVKRVPAMMNGRLIKVGEGCPPELKAGLTVRFVPHGGTLLPVPEGEAERMVLPDHQIIGIVEA